MAEGGETAGAFLKDKYSPQKTLKKKSHQQVVKALFKTLKGD